jgi:hypothetical protein
LWLIARGTVEPGPMSKYITEKEKELNLKIREHTLLSIQID